MPQVTEILSPLVVPLVTLGAGWFVSTRVADRWERRKKYREMNSLAGIEFQALYGEFLATWRQWDTIKRFGDKVHFSDDSAASCLRQAASIEGKIEALLARLATERQLSEKEIAVLGSVRQGFQSLRRAIRRNETLDWRGTNYYASFKSLCAYTTKMLSVSEVEKPPSVEIAIDNFLQITDLSYKRTWTTTLGYGGISKDKAV